MMDSNDSHVRECQELSKWQNRWGWNSFESSLDRISSWIGSGMASGIKPSHVIVV